jgi:hypothetical protein
MGIAATERVQITEDYFGEPFYVINDPKQKEYLLTGITKRPGGTILHLDYLGTEIEVYDFECSLTRDENKYMEGKYATNDEDE